MLGMEKLNSDQSFESENVKEEEHDEAAKQEEENVVLQFLDSLDTYLILMDSLSSTLRQGWLDLASARYSMGSSRVTSALFDLKLHDAATQLQVSQLEEKSPQQDPLLKQPHFSLSRWSSSSGGNYSLRETEFEEEHLLEKNHNSMPRHRHTSKSSVDKELPSKASPKSPRSPLIVDDQVQKERSKSLLVFGTLVSPKLREAQISFETAVETLVQIANMRSLVLSTHVQIRQDKDGAINIQSELAE